MIRSVLFNRHSKNHTSPLPEALRPAVITVDWQRKNKTVFKSVNFAGHIGILTAVKPVGFSQFMQLLS